MLDEVMLIIRFFDSILEEEVKQQEPEPIPTKMLKKSDLLKKFYSDEVGVELNLDERFVGCFR